MMTYTLISDILSDKSKFTKEEYEILNTYINKSEAEYNIKRAERIAATDTKYLVRRKLFEKYNLDALKHKELLLNNSLEEFNAHKEIMLQCLSILQSLVNNPNVLDTLGDILSSDWYGGQDFKQFLCSVINNHEQKLNEIHTEIYNIRNTPSLLFIPELFADEHAELKKLPAYDVPDSRLIAKFIDLTNNNYPLIP